MALVFVLGVSSQVWAGLPPAIYAPNYLADLADNHVSPHCDSKAQCVEIIGGAEIDLKNNGPDYLEDALYIRYHDGWKQMNLKQYAWDVYCIEQNSCSGLLPEMSEWITEQLDNITYEDLPVEYAFAQYWVNAKHPIVDKQDWIDAGVGAKALESWKNSTDWNTVNERVYTLTSRAQPMDDVVSIELHKPIVLYPPGGLFDQYNGLGYTQHFTPSATTTLGVEYAQWFFHIAPGTEYEYWPRVELSPERNLETGLIRGRHVKFSPAPDFQGECGVVIYGTSRKSASYSGFTVEGFKKGICAGANAKAILHGVMVADNEIGIEGSNLVIVDSYVIDNAIGLRISNSLVVNTAIEGNHMGISDWEGGGYVFTPTGGFRLKDQTIIQYEQPYYFNGFSGKGSLYELYPQLKLPKWMIVARDTMKLSNGDEKNGWTVIGAVEYDPSQYGDKPLTVLFYRSDVNDNPTELVHAKVLYDNYSGMFTLNTFLDETLLNTGDRVVVQVYPGNWANLVQEISQIKADKGKVDVETRFKYYQETMAAFIYFSEGLEFKEKIAPSVPANPFILPEKDDVVVWEPKPNSKSMDQYPRPRGY